MSTASNIINFQYIKVGTSTYSGNADPVNVAFRKINSNFTAIAGSLSNIIVPVASTVNTGTVKIGQGINVATDGTISIGQTVHIGAPGNLTGAYGDSQGTLATDNNILYVSTGSFSPTYAINPDQIATGTVFVETTSSFIISDAAAAAQNYIAGTWVLYDTNYRAYPIQSITVNQFTQPITIFQLAEAVNYTTSSTFYIATKDEWHRLPYLNHQGFLPVSVIPYQVGNISYSPSSGTGLVSTIGTTAGDLNINPHGNFVVDVNSIFQGNVALSGTITVSTITSVGNLNISPIGNITIRNPIHITSATNIDGILTANPNIIHSIGGISMGPISTITTGTLGELITTNVSQPDLYILPYGDIRLGDDGHPVSTHFVGNSDITGSLSITADLQVQNMATLGTVKLPSLLYGTTSTWLTDNITHDGNYNLEIDIVNQMIINPAQWLEVTQQVRALDYVNQAGTGFAHFSLGIDVANLAVFDNKWVIGPNTLNALPGNLLTIVGGSGVGDSLRIATNNVTGSIAITSTNASAVIGNGVQLKGSSNGSQFNLTDAAYITVGGQTWKLDQYGQLTFPDATIQTTAFTGNLNIANIVVNNLATLQKLTILTTATVNGPLVVNGASTLNSDLTVGGNALITGNLTVLGSNTVVNSTSVSVEDAVIDIGGGAGGGALTANDGLNKGIALHYFDTQDNRMFLGRDFNTGRLILRNNIDPGASTVYNHDYSTHGGWAGATFGSLILAGGVNSTSTGTGDLQVYGGVGIAGDLFVGGALTLNGNEVTIGGATFNNGLTLSGSTTPGAEYLTLNNGQGTVTFQVDSATGNTFAYGTLNVTGATQITGLASLQNNLNLAGDFAIGANKFTVASASGNTTIGGLLTLQSTANISGNLNVTGTVSVNNNKVLIVASSGNTSIAGTLSAGGNFAIATNKFTVSSSTGNTTVAGTLDVSSATSLMSSLNVVGATALNSTLGVLGSVNVGSGAFTVDSATGNVAALGTLNVTGGTILSSGLSVAGATYLNSIANVAGDFSVNTNKFTVVSTTGNVTIAGNTVINSGLTVANATTLNNTLTVANTLTANSSLIVAGASTLSSSLYVSGATILNSTLATAGRVTFTNVTPATSTGTGALVVIGGASIGNSLFVGLNVNAVQGNFSGPVTDSNNRVITSVTPGGSIGINISNLVSQGPNASFIINNLGVISVANGTDTVVSATTGTNVQINNVSTLQTVTGRGATTPTAISITNATQSTATSNGALTVTGGVGIGGNLNVGGSLNLSGGVTISGNIAGAAITDNGNRVVTSVVPSGSVGINISNLVSNGTATSFTVNNLGVVNLSGTQYNIVASAATGTVVLNLGNTGTAGTYAYPSSMTTDQFGRVNTVVANTATGSGGQVLGNSPTVNAPTITGNPVLSAYTGYVYANGSGQLTASPYVPGAVVTGTVPAAYTATMLTATLQFSVSGDVSSPTQNFNGTQNVIMNTTLATVTQANSGNFVKITLDTKGRVTGNTAVTAVDIANILGSTAVTNASNLLTAVSTTSSIFYPTFVAGTISYQAYNVNTAFSFNPGTGLLTAPDLALTNNAQSTSTNTGALTVAGGAGIAGNAYIGGLLNVAGNAYITGDLYVDGTQTYVNSLNVQTGDKVFYLSTASSNATLAFNSGLAIGPVGATYVQLFFDGNISWKSKGNLVPDGTYSLGATANQWNTIYGSAVYDNNNRVLTNITAGTGTQIVSTGNTVRQVNIIPATNSVIGGVKGSATINIASDGTISTVGTQTNITAVGTLTSLTVQSNNATANYTVKFAGNGSGDQLAFITSGTPGGGIQMQSVNSAINGYAPLEIDGSTIVFTPNGSSRTLVLNSDASASFLSNVTFGGITTVGPTGLSATPGNTVYINGGTGSGDSINIRTLDANGTVDISSNVAKLELNSTAAVLSNNLNNPSTNLTLLGTTAEFLVQGALWQFSNNSVKFPDGTYQYTSATPPTTTATAAIVLATSGTIGNGSIAVLSFANQISVPYNTGDTIVVAGVAPAGYNGTYTVVSGNNNSVTINSTATGAQTVSGTITKNSVLGFVQLGNNIYGAGDGTISIHTATNAIAGVVKIGTGVYAAADGTISIPAGAGGVISVTGTANQVIASASTGNITLSLPQSISTTSAVVFGSVTSTGNVTDNGNRVVTQVDPVAGAGINISGLTANGPTVGFTINNLGVTSLTGSTNINVSQSTGSVTVSHNTLSNFVVGNVTSTGTVSATVVNDNGNRVVTSVAGSSAISVSGTAPSLTITNTGVTALTGAATIKVSASTGSITLTDLGVTNIQPGTGITVNANTGSVTVTNAGVTAFNGSTGNVFGVGSATAGTGISVSASTGSVTITNTGVTAVNGSTGSVLVVNSVNAGTNVAVSATTGSVTVSVPNIGVTAVNGSTGSVLVVSSITAGTGISVSTSTGSVTLTNLGVQTVTGTANQITASASTGAVTLSLPQSIATSSTVQFGGVTASILTATSALGYGTGAGGTVTQTVSASSTVAINKLSGQITLISASRGSGYTTFSVTNTLVQFTDVIHICQQYTGIANTLYIPAIQSVGNGWFSVSVWAQNSTPNEAPVFNFAVIKAVNA